MLLVAAKSGAAQTHRSDFEQAGFDVEFAGDEAAAFEICRLRRSTLRAIVILETEHGGDPVATALVHRFSYAMPSVPCVLLPVGASAAESEFALRTAIRWSSVAYLSAAAAR